MVELESFSVKNTEKVISEVSKILSKALAEPAEVLNPFSSRFFSFFNFTLLDSPGRTPAEFLNN
jgi:hypothetical protein